MQYRESISDLAESHTSEEFTPLSTDRFDRQKPFQFKINALEAKKQQIRLKREELKSNTAITASQLRQEIDRHKKTLQSLSSTYDHLKERFTGFAKLSSSRLIGAVSNNLEDKLEKKKRLTQQKVSILRDTQQCLQFIQQLTLEKQAIGQQLSTGIFEKETKLQVRLEALKGTEALLRLKLKTLQQKFPHQQSNSIDQKHLNFKIQLQQESTTITQHRKAIIELESVDRNNIRQIARLNSNLQEESSKNEERQKRLDIVGSDVDQVDIILGNLKSICHDNTTTEQSLSMGMAFLSGFLEQVKLQNQTLKSQNIGLWTKCKQVMNELQHLEEMLSQNSQVIGRIQNTCKQIN